MRLISVFYIVLILLYIRFIYEDTNYDGLILYFLTLTVGRFLYFDFTVKSFLETMRGVLENLPLLVIMSAYSGFVCWYGFHVGFTAEIKWCHFEHLSCPSVYGLLDLSAPQNRNFKACDTKNLKPAFFYQPYIKKLCRSEFCIFCSAELFLFNVLFYMPNSSAKPCTTKAASQAITHWETTTPAAHLPPSSRLMEATAATHGV